MPSKPNRTGTPDSQNDPPSRSPTLSPTLSPSKSRHELFSIARGYQVRIADLEGEIKILKRTRLADVTNDVDGDGEGSDVEPVAKKSRKGDGSEDDKLLAEVKKLGRRFVLQYGMWLIKGTETLLVEVDEDYEAGERFENEDNKVQGQLQDLRECIPAAFHPQMGNLWFGKTFVQEMAQQLSNTAKRIRHEAVIAIFGATYAARMGSSRDREYFRELLGYNEDTKTWSVFSVEVLHGIYNGEYDNKQIFRSETLMKIYVALIRGPRAPVGLMQGLSVHPPAPTMEGIHHIQHTTPGAIAACAILARWALSPDVHLKTPGDRTGINYAADFDAYLERLQRGLRDRKRWARQLFREWDATIFPLHPSKFGGRQTSGEQQKVRDEEIQATQDIDDAASESEESGDEEPIQNDEEEEPQSNEQPEPED